MKQENLKKYNELLKKHEILNERFAKLEKLEEELEANTTMSDETRLNNLNKLAEEYEKIANLMKGITDEAKELEKKVSEEE